MIASAAAASSPFTPVRFGDYLLVRRLGAGGMGEVFLAKTSGLGDIEKLLVVKTLKAEHTNDPEYVGRFIDEARVVVQLTHRNICQVFDVGRAGEQYYLAMEHIDGRDLKTLLLRANAQAAALAPGVAGFVAGEVLEALDYAHRLTDPATGQPLHLVHRDVSPQNVMVNFEGEVKLIDFGLAQSRLKVERTRPDMVMGKMAYMAPEQARGEALSPRVDVFALAVTLYEMLTGRRYYEGLSAPEVLDLVGGRTPDGREYRPPHLAALDVDMRRILDEALRRDPEKRTPDCAAFKEAIDAWLLDKKLRVGTRQVRELMAEHFSVEQARDRELFARIRGETFDGAASLARRDETVRIAVDPTLFDTSSSAVAAGPGETGDVFASSQESLSTEKGRPAARVEATQRVARNQGASAAPRSRARLVVVLAAAAVLAVGAVGLGVWQLGASSAGATVRDEPSQPSPAPPGGTPAEPRVPEARGPLPLDAEATGEGDPAGEEEIQAPTHKKPRVAKAGKPRPPAKRPTRPSSTAQDNSRPIEASSASSEALSEQARPVPSSPATDAQKDDIASLTRRTAALAGCACGGIEQKAGLVRIMGALERRSHLAKVEACEASCRR